MMICSLTMSFFVLDATFVQVDLVQRGVWQLIVLVVMFLVVMVKIVYNRSSGLLSALGDGVWRSGCIVSRQKWHLKEDVFRLNHEYSLPTF